MDDYGSVMEKRKDRLIQSLFCENNNYNDLEKNIVFFVATAKGAVSFSDLKKSFNFPNIDLCEVLHKLTEENWLIEKIRFQEKYYSFNLNQKISDIMKQGDSSSNYFII